MSVEFIVGIVVVLLVVGVVLYLKKNPSAVTNAETALKADVANAVADLKQHVTQTVTPPQAVDHAAIIQAAASVVAAAQPKAQDPAALLGGSNLPPAANVTPTSAGGDQGQSMMLNALLGSQTIKRPEVVQPPADDPTKRAPYPSYWRFNGNAPGEIHSPGFTCPAAEYVTSTDFSNSFVVKVDGVEVSQLQPFPMSEGSHTASVTNTHEGTWTGTLQFRKHEPVHANPLGK